MRKEYSDLPKGQQKTFMLDTVITIITVVGSMIIYAAWLLFAAHKFLGHWSLDTDLFNGLVLFGLGFAMLGGVFAAYVIKNALGLYTDLDLERAEKRVLKIKGALD